MFESAVPLVCFWENKVLDFVVCYVSFCICIVFQNTQPLGCVICVVMICCILLCFAIFCIVFLENPPVGPMD